MFVVRYVLMVKKVSPGRIWLPVLSTTTAMSAAVDVVIESDWG